MANIGKNRLTFLDDGEPTAPAKPRTPEEQAEADWQNDFVTRTMASHESDERQINLVEAISAVLPLLKDVTVAELLEEVRKESEVRRK